MTITTRISAELNQADPAELISLAERCLAEHAAVTVTRAPQVGVVAAQVREPVAEERFLLADVLVCQAEVEYRGAYGWAMRLGDDEVGTLAAAILAAEYGAGGPFAADIESLVDATETARTEARAAEWERLAPTIVEFQEVL